MSLLKKLQVYTHQVSNALEESSQKVFLINILSKSFTFLFVQ